MPQPQQHWEGYNRLVFKCTATNLLLCSSTVCGLSKYIVDKFRQVIISTLLVGQVPHFHSNSSLARVRCNYQKN